MTANASPELFNRSDGLVVRNVKRNVIGSGEQLRLKVEGTTMHLITRRRLFQALGPAIENERQPKPVSARGCCSCNFMQNASGHGWVDG